MIARQLLGSRWSRNSAFATGTTRSSCPLMIVTGVVDLRQELGEDPQLLGVAVQVAHRLDETIAVVAGTEVRADVVGDPAADGVEGRVDDRARIRPAAFVEVGVEYPRLQRLAELERDCRAPCVGFQNRLRMLTRSFRLRVRS
jgi:hypothetical protein